MNQRAAKKEVRLEVAARCARKRTGKSRGARAERLIYLVLEALLNSAAFDPSFFPCSQRDLRSTDILRDGEIPVCAIDRFVAALEVGR